MDTRLVKTSMQILRLFLTQYLKESHQENLTSGPFFHTFNKEAMDKISFGSNQIINEIGRDRSHISKAIEFLKRVELLEEFGKWEKGKIKDTRITFLGLSIAELIHGVEQYNYFYSRFHEKLEAHYKLPKDIDQEKKQEYLIKKGWDNSIVNTYDIALSNVRDIEFSLLSCFITALIEKYTVIMLLTRTKSDVKYMMEEIMLSFIRDQLRRVSIMSEYLPDGTKQYAIKRLLSKLVHPSFISYTSVIEYMKFDYEDLPNDGNKKFVKEDVKMLLKSLLSILKPKPQMIPVGLDLEKYQEFLPGIDIEAVHEEWSNLGVGDNQILSMIQTESTTEYSKFLVREDGTYFDATNDFVELAIGKNGTDIKPWKIARCSFFRTKMVIAIHKDVRINAFSSEFQSNYEKGKKAIYDALKEIDYVNEFGIDMPIFEIIRDEKGFIKKIIIDNLARDVQDMIRSVMMQIIVRILMKTNHKFLEFMEKIRETMQQQKELEKNGDKDNTIRYSEDEENRKTEETRTNRIGADRENDIKYDLLRVDGMYNTDKSDK